MTAESVTARGQVHDPVERDRQFRHRRPLGGAVVDRHAGDRRGGRGRLGRPAVPLPQFRPVVADPGRLEVDRPVEEDAGRGQFRSPAEGPVGLRYDNPGRYPTGSPVGSTQAVPAAVPSVR